MSEGEAETHLSMKNDLHILHHGQPPLYHCLFASAAHKPKWPENLWDSGRLIYSLYDKDACLPPRESKSDRILRFNSRFESGNLLYAYHLNENSYHCVLEYDQSKSQNCQWFYFQIRNTRKDVNYQFYISGFRKGTGVFCSGSKIFMYSEKNARKNGINWVRSGQAYGYGVTMNDAPKKRASLQFQIRFPFDNDTVYFCYALPYTYSNLLRDVGRWKMSLSVVSECLCKTLGGRDCPLLTITHPGDASSKKCIFLTSRIHPGESNSSYVMQGLIDFLISGNPVARYLLDNFVVKVVPMMCIDGVIEGFYRCSLSGDDLNRVWENPSPEQHPVVWNVKNLMKEISSSMPIEVYIDLHGHSRMHGTFAYGCPNNSNPVLVNAERIFPRIMSVLSDTFCWQKCVFSYPDALKSASRIVVRKEIGVVHCFTVESSFGGVSSGPMSGYLYDERIWRDIGAKICESLYHLLNPVTTHIRRCIERELTSTVDLPKMETLIAKPLGKVTKPKVVKRGFLKTNCKHV